MHELTILYYICYGQRSCGKCEEHIDGFLSKHHGQMSTDSLSDDVVTAALEDCPTGALQCDAVD